MTGHFTSYKIRPNHELATDLPCDRSEERAALPRRNQLPLQPMIRSRCDDVAAGLDCRSDHTDALPAAQAARGLCMTMSPIRLLKLAEQSA